MDEKWKTWAKDIFSRYDFDATLIFEDDNFFIMDWKDKNGSGEYATRYIVDKQKGDLIIKGDSGYCIASWCNPVTVDNLAHYINSTGYFIDKMRCASNKYTYNFNDIEEDLADEKQKYLKKIHDGDLDGIAEEELEEDFYRMQEILEDYSVNEDTTYPDELASLMGKYDADWFESAFARLGKRVDKRIYLWTYGYQEGVRRLRGRDC